MQLTKMTGVPITICEIAHDHQMQIFSDVIHGAIQNKHLI